MNTVVKPTRKRPKLVWAVFFFYIISVGYTVSFFFRVFYPILVTPGHEVDYRNLLTFDLVVTALTGIFNLAGAIAILRLRKIAFYLFAISFVIGILQGLVNTFTTNFSTALGGTGIVSNFFGFGVLFAVCLYAWRLKARRILL